MVWIYKQNCKIVYTSMVLKTNDTGKNVWLAYYYMYYTVTV